MRAKTFLLCLILNYSVILMGQINLGIHLNTEEATPSYTLFDTNNKTYLIDNCGEVVHQWNTFDMRYHSKLLPNGNIIFIQYGEIYEMNWEGEIVKQFSDNDPTIHLEYEVIVLPNGNYLCVGRKEFSYSDFANIGYQIPAGSSPSQIDVVVELDKDTGIIVWQWILGDHVIQERDANAPNYGVIKDNPQLLNMDVIATYDWENTESFMINGMDYNPELDQIILSVRKISEIVIIDHSTTTAEAASHTGGQSGKGGDILWRWGNPANYNAGTTADRYLYFQHNPKWITQGPHIGKISCYNNGLNRPGIPFGEGYSTVPLLEPQMDSEGHYLMDNEGAFLPAEPQLEIGKFTTGTDFFSGYTSGAEFMANGNIYITEGHLGRIFEVDPAGEMTWFYKIPGIYYIFRTQKYALDYVAFEGRDLVPMGQIPGTENDYVCNIIEGTEDAPHSPNTFALMKIDAAKYGLANQLERGFYYQIYNLQGVLLEKGQSASAYFELDLNGNPSGYYVLNVADKKTLHWQAFKVVVD